MHTNCLRLASWLAAVACGLFGSLPADAMDLLNGSTNHVLFVTNYVGEAHVSAGQALSWPTDVSGLTGVGVDGVYSFSFLGVNGHDYRVLCSNSGQAFLVDESAAQTGWFWWGFALAFGFGMLGLGARWASRAIGGGLNE